jgi:hypothetical protein
VAARGRTVAFAAARAGFMQRHRHAREGGWVQRLPDLEFDLNEEPR